MENDDRADDVACAVVDWRGRVFNGEFKSIAAYEDAILGESDRPVFHHSHFHGVSGNLACLAVNNLEDFSEWQTLCFVAAPAGHGFSDKIEIGDVTGNVGAEYGVADGAECD